jgi:aspartate 1-decarboxylase
MAAGLSREIGTHAMLVTICKSKVHRVRVTEADLDYEGSITIDRRLLEAAAMLPHEKVQVVNLNNGARFETYVLVGERDSGTICLNGPAARLGQVGDLLIVISYCHLDVAEAKKYEPRIVHVDKNNRIVKEA